MYTSFSLAGAHDMYDVNPFAEGGMLSSATRTVSAAVSDTVCTNGGGEGSDRAVGEGLQTCIAVTETAAVAVSVTERSAATLAERQRLAVARI